MAGGPAGLPSGAGSSLNSNFGLALADGHAAGGLERPAFDPLADQLDLGVGDLGRVRRHLRLFLVR